MPGYIGSFFNVIIEFPSLLGKVYKNMYYYHNLTGDSERCQLYKAIISNKHRKIELLVNKGKTNINSPFTSEEIPAGVHKKEFHNKTPLLIAMERGNLEAIETLLKLGAEKHVVLENNETYLDRLFHLPLFEKNIDKSENFNLQTELFSKKKDKILKIAELFLKGNKAISIDHPNAITGKTILQKICSSDFTDNKVIVKFLPEIVGFLITRTKNYNPADKEGKKTINSLATAKNESYPNPIYQEKLQEINKKLGKEFLSLKKLIDEYRVYNEKYEVRENIIYKLSQDMRKHFEKNCMDPHLLKNVELDFAELRKTSNFEKSFARNDQSIIDHCTIFLSKFSEEVEDLNSHCSKQNSYTNQPELDTIRTLLELGKNSNEDLVKFHVLNGALKKLNKNTFLELRKIGYEMDFLDDVLKQAFLEKDLLRIKFLIDIKAKVPLNLDQPLIHYLVASKNCSPAHIIEVIESLKKSGIDLTKFGMPDGKTAFEFIIDHQKDYTPKNFDVMKKYLPHPKSCWQNFSSYFNESIEIASDSTEQKIGLDQENKSNLIGDTRSYH